jgi:uncharacterized protein YneF (UPF0154 family)
MNIILAIVLIVIALLGGAIGGLFFARNQMKKQFGENPMIPLNEQAIRDILGSMGQSPSQKQINLIMRKLKENAK